MKNDTHPNFPIWNLVLESESSLLLGRWPIVIDSKAQVQLGPAQPNSTPDHRPRCPLGLRKPSLGVKKKQNANANSRLGDGTEWNRRLRCQLWRNAINGWLRTIYFISTTSSLMLHPTLNPNCKPLIFELQFRFFWVGFWVWFCFFFPRPKLRRDRHLEYLYGGLRFLGPSFCVLDAK